MYVRCTKGEMQKTKLKAAEIRPGLAKTGIHKKQPHNKPYAYILCIYIYIYIHIYVYIYTVYTESLSPVMVDFHGFWTFQTSAVLASRTTTTCSLSVMWLGFTTWPIHRRWDGGQGSYGGFQLAIAGPPQNGWFISRKVPIKNGWELGVALWLRKPPFFGR